MGAAAKKCNDCGIALVYWWGLSGELLAVCRQCQRTWLVAVVDTTPL